MESGQIGIIERLSVRARPPELPIMYQSWGDLLFMHWPVPAQTFRPLIPEPLAIDTHDGVAWIDLCLKRRVSDAVFRSLVADSQATARSAALTKRSREGVNDEVRG